MNIWSFETYVADSPIHGKGRYTYEPIRMGETVLRIDGNIHKNENQSYVNHSIDNNLDYVGSNTWVASRDIDPNEELTMNYLQWIKELPF